MGTKDFASAVIERLGKKPQKLSPVSWFVFGPIACSDHEVQQVDYVSHETSGRKDVSPPSFEIKEEPIFPVPRKAFDGVDIFVDYDPATGRDPNRLASVLQRAVGKGEFDGWILVGRLVMSPSDFKLSMISNRGVVVWPNGHPDTFHADHWRW